MEVTQRLCNIPQRPLGSERILTSLKFGSNRSEITVRLFLGKNSPALVVIDSFLDERVENRLITWNAVGEDEQRGF